MSITIERAGLLCAVFALGGVGVWARCGAPEPTTAVVGSDAARDRPRSYGDPRSTGGRATRDGAVYEDGGIPELDEAWRASRCWSLRVVDDRARPTAALVLAAEVSRVGEQPHPYRSEARAGEDGRVEVCTPSDAVIALDAWTDDGRWGHASVGVSPNYEDGEGLEPTGVVEVVVFEPATLVGRVVDEDGAPVAGIPLHVGYFDGYYGDEIASPGGDANEALTGQASWSSAPDGSFEIPLGEMRLVVLWAQDDAHLPILAGPIAARPGTAVEVELRVRRAGRLRGTVVHDGEPIPNASVEVMTNDRAVMTSAGDGTFEIGGLEPGVPVWLTASADGFVGRTSREVPREDALVVELDLGAVVEVTFALPRALEDCLDTTDAFADESTEGTLEAELEVPHEDPWRAATRDPAVPIVFDSLPAGPMHLEGWAFGASGELDIDIPRGGSLRVVLPVEIPPGAGVVRLEVEPEPDGDDPGYLVMSVRRRGELVRWLELGRSRRTCAVLEGGEHWLHAEVGGGRTSDVRIDVRPGGTVTEAVRIGPAPPPRVIQLDEIELEGEEPPECTPPIHVVSARDQTLIAAVGPGARGLLPGDVVVELDGATASYPIAEQLWGPPGSVASLTVQRPDGTVARVALGRTRCE